MEWISVKDRLPEHYNDVFIHCAEMLPPITRTAHYQPNNKSWYKHSPFIPDDFVTHWAEITTPRAGVVENFEHELTKEPQTEALNKHDVMQRSELLPIAFTQWYSGMEREKILKAYERYKRESGNSA